MDSTIPPAHWSFEEVLMAGLVMNGKWKMLVVIIGHIIIVWD